MRRTLSGFVAMLCLLTLFLSSGACLALPQNTLATAPHHHNTANTAEHACCPQRSPTHEHTSTTCCTVHHQPVSASTGAELEQLAIAPHATLPISIQISAAIYPTAKTQTIATQPPKLIALRI